MPSVQFTYALRRFFPGLESMDVASGRVKDILIAVEQRYPGMIGYILTDQGTLRPHVNIFVDGELISDREQLSDFADKNSEVYIMQALSGG